MRIVDGFSVPETGDQVDHVIGDQVCPGVVLWWDAQRRQAAVMFGSDPAKYLMIDVDLLRQGVMASRFEGSNVDRARATVDQAPGALSWGCRTVLFALEAAGEAGLTDFEHAARTSMPASTVARRRGELRASQPALVVDSGRRRDTPDSSQATVWLLSPDGHVLATSMRQRGVA